MVSRALRFGSAAAAYERYRLGYPDRIADDVLAYAGRPLRTALEIGAGTGKATRVFAARGIAVTATDPDAAMLAELARHVPGVRTVRAALEDLGPEPVHDLVFAAASLHWTEPEGRWARIAGLLAERGVVASFGGPIQLTDELEAAVREARSPFLADDGVPSPDGTPPEAEMQWPGTELLRSREFTDVRQSRIPRRVEVGAEEYVGHLSTVSSYLGLPEDVRREAFARIRAVLPDRVVLGLDLTLHLARLRAADG